jgi:hypothetical protein
MQRLLHGGQFLVYSTLFEILYADLVPLYFIDLLLIS